MDDRIDATFAMEREREDMEERREAALGRQDGDWETAFPDCDEHLLCSTVFDRARRTSSAIDELDELISENVDEIATRRCLNPDTLLAAWQTKERHVPGPPDSILGLIAWLWQQLSDARDVIDLELTDPTAPARPNTKAVILRNISGAMALINTVKTIWEEQLASEKAFESQTQATKTFADKVFSCVHNPLKERKDHE